MTRRAPALALAALLLAPAGGATAATAAEGASIFASGARPGAPPPRAAAASATVPATALPCASCHGAGGAGGRAEGGIAAPPIAWPVLSRPAPGRGGYDEAALIRAVTRGIAPGGRELDRVMPRYALSLEDGAALVAFLRGLGTGGEPGVETDAVHIGLLLPAGPAGDTFAASFAAALDRAAPGGIFGRRVTLHRAVAAGTAEAEAGVAALLARPSLALVSALPPGEAALAAADAAGAAGVPLLATTAPPVAETRAYALLPGPVEEASAALRALPDPSRALILLQPGAARGLAEAIAARIGRSAEDEPRIIGPEELGDALPGATGVLLPDGSAPLDRWSLGLLRAAQVPVLLPASAGLAAALPLAGALERPVTLAVGIPPASIAGAGAAAARFQAGPGPSGGAAGRLGHAAAEVAVEALRRAGRGVTRERLAAAFAGADPFETGAFPALTLAGGSRAAPGRIWLLRVDGQGRLQGRPEEVRP